LIHSGQDKTFWPFYVKVYVHFTLKAIKNQVCVSILLPDNSYAFDASSFDPGAIVKKSGIGSDRLDVKLATSHEAEDDEVQIIDLVEADVSLQIASWIKDKLILLGKASHEEVVFRNDTSKSVGDRLIHSWLNISKRWDVDVEVELMCAREGIPVFASLISIKTRLEGEAAVIMAKGDSDWSLADDLLDKVDEIGRVLVTCSLACVAGYSLDELRGVIEEAGRVMNLA
jgi:hypothetical protein